MNISVSLLACSLAFVKMICPRPGKTNHLRTFIVLRNVNSKTSLSYNLAVISSRGMGFTLEIQHLFSFE